MRRKNKLELYGTTNSKYKQRWFEYDVKAFAKL